MIFVFYLNIFFFFFNVTATTDIYTLSLHDALPICQRARKCLASRDAAVGIEPLNCARYVCKLGAILAVGVEIGRARLNSSHQIISYAVFCLKKKKEQPEV